MPITVKHLPPLAPVARASYVTGLGEYRQIQQELAQREAARQQQAFLAQQDMALRQQQMEMAAQRAAMDYEDNLFQRGLAMEDRDLRRQDTLNKQRQFEQEFQATQERNAINRMQAEAYTEQTRRAGMPKPLDVNEWNMQSVSDLEKQASWLEANLAKMPLDQQGKEKVGPLLTHLQGVRKQRADLDPAGYADALSKWFAQVEDANVMAHMEPELTPEEQFARDTFVDEHGNRFSRNSELKPLLKVDKPDEEKVPVWRMRTVSEYYEAKPTEKAKMEKAAIDELRTAWLRKQPENTTPAAADAYMPSDEEIVKKEMEIFERMKKRERLRLQMELEAAEKGEAPQVKARKSAKAEKATIRMIEDTMKEFDRRAGRAAVPMPSAGMPVVAEDFKFEQDKETGAWRLTRQ